MRSSTFPQLCYIHEIDVECSIAINHECTEVEISYIRDACIVPRWNDKSKEDRYENFGVGILTMGVIVEWLNW